ncbi:hypothetical protein STENM327S_08721 [Streptomyces tendae]
MPVGAAGRAAHDLPDRAGRPVGGRRAGQRGAVGGEVVAGEDAGQVAGRGAERVVGGERRQAAGPGQQGGDASAGLVEGGLVAAVRRHALPGDPLGVGHRAVARVELVPGGEAAGAHEVVVAQCLAHP